MTKYIAFLRGINVGGNKKVSMAELKKAFEKAKFSNVKTLLNSGNVIFEAAKTTDEVLCKNIETLLEKTFGFQISTLIRSATQLQKLVDSNPFKKIKVTPQTRLYITFMNEKSKSSKLKIPYTSPEKDFEILQVTPTEIISVLTVTPNHGTVDGMKILEQEYGKNITTRNWNTVLKTLK